MTIREAPIIEYLQKNIKYIRVRFLDLVKAGYFTGCRLYRVIPGFLVQFGVAADPAVQAKWQNQKLADEENKVQFRAGTLSYAGAGADSRASLTKALLLVWLFFRRSLAQRRV